MRREALPCLSTVGQQAITEYEDSLRSLTDLSPVTLRNYLSDLRQFVAWYESGNSETELDFLPQRVTTPILTGYRRYLQQNLQLKPASVNRYLVTLKGYFSWAKSTGKININPAAVVKLIPQVKSPPRHLSDLSESSLVAAVNNYGSLRDRTIIILMLHTGLRASELCHLKPEHLYLRKRSGRVQVYGKRNKYREVPLNVTARRVLEEYLPTIPVNSIYLFPSHKTGTVMTTRALGYLVSKYARLARLEPISPHDLRHRFGYRMAELVPLHRLAQIMGHDSLDTTMVYVRSTRGDLQKDVEKIAWN
jgi:integrase/recombinase XerC